MVSHPLVCLFSSSAALLEATLLVLSLASGRFLIRRGVSFALGSLGVFLDDAFIRVITTIFRSRALGRLIRLITVFTLLCRLLLLSFRLLLRLISGWLLR